MMTNGNTNKKTDKTANANTEKTPLTMALGGVNNYSIITNGNTNTDKTANTDTDRRERHP